MGVEKNSRRSDGLGVVYVLLVCAFSLAPLLIARGIVVHPCLWAEDGRFFLADAWNAPGAANFVKPHAGYLHTFPRLIAGMASLLPLEFAPTVFLVGAWIVQFLPLAYVFNRRSDDILPNLPSKVLFATCYCFAGGMDETYLNTTNLMWYLPVTVAFVLASPMSKSNLVRAAERIFLFVSALTGPFAPFYFLCTLFTKRDDERKRRLATFAVGCIALAVCMLRSHRGGHAALSAEGGLLSNLLTILASDISIFASLIGQSNGTLWLIGSAVLIGVYVAMVWFAFKQRNRFAFFLLTISLLVLATSVYVTGEGAMLSRYSMLPALSFVFAACVLAVSPTAAKPVRALYAVVTVLCLASMFPPQPIVRTPSPDWAMQVRTIYAPAKRGDFVTLTVAPKGWFAVLRRR